MATAGQLLARAHAEELQVNGLQARLSHASSYTEKRNLQHRIRELEDSIDALYARYLRAEGKTPATVFGTTKKPRTYAGLSSRMDVSDDGLYFSNPGPTFANSQRVWVRVTVDMAQKSPFATTKTLMPLFCRATWRVPKGWVSLDVYPRFGRIERFCSWPFVLTREFRAPSSGSTSAKKFGVYIDPYFPVDDDVTAATGNAVATDSDVVAHFDAGTYRFYTKTGNVLSSYADPPIAASDWSVADGDEHLFYTDGSTYKLVRRILSGPYSGKYVVTNQSGITLIDQTDEDE